MHWLRRSGIMAFLILCGINIAYANGSNNKESFLQEFKISISEEEKYQLDANLITEADILSVHINDDWDDVEKRIKIVNRIKELRKQSILLFVNMKVIFCDVAPLVINERTLLPIRTVADALNSEVKWDGKTSTATISRTGTVIIIDIANNIVTVNGKQVILDVSPQIIKGRIMLPIRFIAEAFNEKVTWDNLTTSVMIGRTETDQSESTYNTNYNNSTDYSTDNQVSGDDSTSDEESPN